MRWQREKDGVWQMRRLLVKDMSLTDEDLDRIDQTFRERFSGLMNLCGVSCIEVARSIGVYPSSVQIWAKGKNGKSGALPKIYYMVAIANYFNTTIDYLVGLTDERGRTQGTIDSQGGKNE